jgi:hypothetical protein
MRRLSLTVSWSSHFLPREVPETFHWYGDNSITIQFVLELLAAIFIFWKRVRYSRQK